MMVDMHDDGGMSIKRMKCVLLESALGEVGAFDASAFWWSKNYFFLILAK